ncbi:DNA-binding response regulator [Sphingomonas oleivorans]|uniref:DNA-binding response regulator n=1 Tax=Sphingomonas oleivorans TaxID=1735121 RepID=A0A2T5FWV3_9SPHN|nr:response regulator transcription factor [Sphingomonas oleivorans]PTQ10270.1 DNA-binding response regulator [Sphingomonas oleivorans]
MSDERSDPIRILIADDHPLLREGIVAVLALEPDMMVVGQAQDGAEAVDLYRELRPDIVLMDLQMPVLDGVEAISRICREFPEARIIVLTTYSGDAQALRALKAGALGYLVKLSLRNELIEAIRAVHEGGRHLQQKIATEIAFGVAEEPLNAREIRVLQLAAIGNSNKQIAHRLELAEETVKGHMKTIFSKLGVADRTHAVTIAARRGIIEL